MISKEGKPLLVIADDVAGDVLNGLLINNMRGMLRSIAVKSPEFGDHRLNTLEDIALFTGGKVLTENDNSKLDKTFLGRAGKIKVNKNKTTLLQGHGCKNMLQNKIKQLQSQLNECTNYAKEKIQT